MCVQESKQGPRLESMEKSSKELGKKVCKEGSKVLGKRVRKKSRQGTRQVCKQEK